MIGDFFHGGIAGVLKKQATSRLHSPDQTQILNDFFEGGVYQSEAHRFLQLFTDPDQHQFISDFVTGGLVQVVRNRLLDATADPANGPRSSPSSPTRSPTTAGDPSPSCSDGLIAAAKGNPVVIGLVNAIFENPVVVAVQHVLGGGPLVGTPLHELPPITPDAAVAPPHTATVPQPAPKTTPVQTVSETPAASARHAAPEPVDEAPVTKVAKAALKEDTEKEAVTTAGTTVSADVVKSGNKVEPAGIESPTRTKSAESSATPSSPVAETPAADDTGVTKDTDDGTGGAATS